MHFHIPEYFTENGISVFGAEHDMQLSSRFPVRVGLTERLMLLPPCFPHKSFQVIALPGFAQFAPGGKSGFDQPAGNIGNNKAGINNGT